MVQGIFETIADRYIHPFVFRSSGQPLLLRELLEINKNYDEGLKLEGKIPGIKLQTGRLVLTFLILWHLVLLPLSLLFHHQLAKVDCHLLIILAVVFTGLFFGTYMMFKEWLIDRMARRYIKEAWQNHFPHFVYEKHHKEVANLYRDAIENDVPNKELFLFIMNKLVEKK